MIDKQFESMGIHTLKQIPDLSDIPELSAEEKAFVDKREPNAKEIKRILGAFKFPPIHLKTPKSDRQTI